VLRASAVVRQAGVPVAAIVAAPFMRMATALSNSWGLPLPLAEYPGVVMTDSDDILRLKTRGLVGQLVRALCVPPAPSLTAEAENDAQPSASAIVATGSLDDIQDSFEVNLWADGLPIVPPTTSRVERFLNRCRRAPDEVLGTLLPERRQLTPWVVAVNGVMAGCRPEYMPVLMAIADVLIDPMFRAEDAGSTPGWEPLVLVAGPLVESLDMNSEAGAMRIGRRSNSSIGRFVRLLLRNVAGLRTPPGDTDKGSFGYSVNVALAEHPRLTRELGWVPFQVEHGFAESDTVVAVQSVVAISPPIYTAGSEARDHLRTLAEMFASTMGGWSVLGLIFGRWTPLLALSASVASVLARNGVSKDDLRRYLYDNCLISAGAMERTAWEVGVTSRDLTLSNLAADGRIPASYALSNDPERLVRMCPVVEDIGIVVAGDPGRNQSRAYINNHQQGPRLVRRVAV
jgi:hypothetical protein